jgi:signal recognition particle subunit SRP19
LKDYKRIILWLDYFNSKLSRKDGRKVPLYLAVGSPTMDELVESVTKLGLITEPVKAKYPKRSFIESGYVSINKGGRKNDLLKEVSRTLGTVRGMRHQKV